MTEVLGERLKVAAWALGGTLPPEQLAEVLKKAVRLMGMDTGGMAPVIRQYPLAGGEGGVGHTIFLPCGEPGLQVSGWWARLKLKLAGWVLGRQRFAATVFQPLVESFIVADDYPELGKTYVIVASCRPFIAAVVGRYLVRKIGPVVEVGGFTL